MKRMIVNTNDPEEVRIAIVENGVLQELHVELAHRESYLGNIYKGKVVNIEPSIGAAFINFGGTRNGFLHASDVVPAYAEDKVSLMDILEGKHRTGVEEGPDAVRQLIDDEEESSDKGEGEDEGGETKKKGRSRRSRRRRKGSSDEDSEAASDEATEAAASETGAEEDAEAIQQDGSEELNGEAGLEDADLDADEESDEELGEDEDLDQDEDLDEDEESDEDDDEGLERIRLRADQDEDEGAPSFEIYDDEIDEDEDLDPEDAGSDEAEAVDGEVDPEADPDQDSDADEEPDDGPDKALPMAAASETDTGPEPEGDSGDSGEGGQRKRRRRRRRRKGGSEDGAESLGEVSTEGDKSAPEAEAKEGGSGRSGRGSRSRSGGGDKGKGSSRSGKDRGSKERGTRGRRGGRGKPGRPSVARRSGPRKPIQELLKKGQELIVQITKEGIGTKGPTLTTYLSLPGRCLVLMPSLPKCGVSRKLDDEKERRRLKRIVKDLDETGKGGIGFIVRTAGRGKTQADLERDLEYLKVLWGVVLKRASSTRAPAPLYVESDLVLRTMRDFFTPDIDEVVVDSEPVFVRVKDFVEKLMPRFVDRIQHHQGHAPLFHSYGIEAAVESLYQPKVELPGGGSIVIEQTEALVAIDVNSGKFKPGTTLEETAYRTNLDAIDEIVRQLRLRDLGGVIIIDFIDMMDEKHRRTVERRFRDALRSDRARINIGRISIFGMLELTRQRVGPGLKRTVFQVCPTCKGSGLVRTVQSKALAVLREMRALAQLPGFHRLEAYTHPEVEAFLANRKRRDTSSIEDVFQREIQVRAEPSYPVDVVHYRFVDRNGGEAKVHVPPGLGVSI